MKKHLSELRKLALVGRKSSNLAFSDNLSASFVCILYTFNSCTHILNSTSKKKGASPNHVF